MWILVKKCAEMEAIYRQKYKRKLRPFVWQYVDTLQVPASVDNERKLTDFLFETCGCGLFMIMLWHKHRSRSPYYSTGLVQWKKHVPKFFRTMIVGIRNQHNSTIYSNRMQNIFKKQNPLWRERQEAWQEKKEEWKEP